MKNKIYRTVYIVAALMLMLIMTSCGNEVTYEPPEDSGTISQQAEFNLPVKNGGEWTCVMYKTVNGKRNEVPADKNAVFAIEQKQSDEEGSKGNTMIILHAQNKGKCEVELTYKEAGADKCKLTYTMRNTMDGQISVLEEKKEAIDKKYKVSKLTGPIIKQQSTSE